MAKFSLIILLLFIFTAPQVMAAQTPNCQPIFGGGPSCEQTDPLSVNKQVQNPQTKEYVDILPTTFPTYGGGQSVLFKVTISNTSNASISKVEVRDIFPDHIDFSKGLGKFDPNTKTLLFTIDELKAKENKVFFIEGKVVTNDKLPADPKERCVINSAIASINDKRSQDNIQVCVSKTISPQTTTSNSTSTKGGLPIYAPSNTKTTPDTGPEAWALIGLLPAGALGVWLRRKTTVYQTSQKTTE